MKTDDQPKAEEVDPAEFKPVPNRKALRDNGLTLPRRRQGFARRQAIKQMRLTYEALA